MSSAYRVEDREGEHLHDLPATLSDPQVSETVWPTTQEVPHSVYGGRSSMDSGGVFEVTVGATDGDHADLMDSIAPERQLTLQFTDISGWVPDLEFTSQAPSFLAALGLESCWRRPGGKAKPPRQILFKLSGTCRPGEVLALMGPSGSGKTTLLSVLGGRLARELKLEGAAMFNGEKMSKRAKRQVGFVLQDDLVFENLTPLEMLYYAALLRLPRTMSKEAKLDRVNTVISALGLEKCSNTIIGGFFRRGISGGERKRVSVAHELLINPSILLLDEPTSGLDSTTAMHLVSTLRRLASGGRAVVTTIHQPSSRLYMQLDKLLLLSEGHVMYYGRASLAADWFHRLGFSMPFGINTADFILDLASGDVSTKKLSASASLYHLVRCAETYLASHRGLDGYQAGQQLSQADFGPDLWVAAQSRRKLDVAAEFKAADLGGAPEVLGALGASSEEATDAEVGTTGLQEESRWGSSYWEQICILFMRAVKTRRFESLQLQDFCQFVLVGLLCGAVWWQAGQTNTTAGAQNAVGLLFFTIIFTGFWSMLQALFTFPSEYKMCLKERASGLYRLGAFYIARTASDLPMEFTVPSLYIILSYFMGGLRRTPGAFFSNWLAVVLTTLVAQSFGLLIGTTIMKVKTAQTVVSVVMLCFLLVGGFYVTHIQSWISWLRYLSFIFYGYNLLLKIEFHGRTFYDCGSVVSPPNLDGCTVVPPGGLSAVLHFPENTEAWPYEPIALLGWLIFFRVSVYVALRMKTNHV